MFLIPAPNAPGAPSLARQSSRRRHRTDKANYSERGTPTRVKRDAMPMRVNRPADWIGGRCASRPTASAHGVSFAGQLLCHRAAGRHEELIPILHQIELMM